MVPESEVRGFSRATDVLKHIKENKECPDVVFSDIEMPGISGLDFAVQFKRICPKAKISQSFGWYINELIYSNGMIAFLQDNLVGSDLRNETISFVVGMGMGLSMPVLLLAPQTFDAPMDYKEQIVRFNSKEQCDRLVGEWFK